MRQARRATFDGVRAVHPSRRLMRAWPAPRCLAATGCSRSAHPVNLPAGQPSLQETVVAGKGDREAPDDRHQRRDHRGERGRQTSVRRSREHDRRVREELDSAPAKTPRCRRSCCASTAPAAPSPERPPLPRDRAVEGAAKRPVVAALHGDLRVGRLLRRDVRGRDPRRRTDPVDGSIGVIFSGLHARGSDGEARASRTRRSRAASSRTRDRCSAACAPRSAPRSSA